MSESHIDILNTNTLSYTDWTVSIVREIIFYQDRHGNQPVVDYIQELEKRKDKDSHIKLDKILKYIDMLLQKEG